MSKVWKSVRLDYRIMQAYYRTFAVVYAAGAVIAIVTKIPALAMAIVMVISAPVAGLYFSVYEKNNLSKLYGVLPLGRLHVVLGRYLYALGFAIANATVSAILAIVVSRIARIGMSSLAFLTYLSGAFFLFSLFVALLFPLYCRFPYSKISVIANLPLYLLMVFAMLVLRRTNLLAQPGQIIQYFTAHLYMIVVTGIGLGLVLLLISCPVSYLIYQRNDL